MEEGLWGQENLASIPAPLAYRPWGPGQVCTSLSLFPSPAGVWAQGLAEGVCECVHGNLPLYLLLGLSGNTPGHHGGAILHQRLHEVIFVCGSAPRSRVPIHTPARPFWFGEMQWQADVRPGGSTEGEFASPSFVEEAVPHPHRLLSVLEFSGRGMVPTTHCVCGGGLGWTVTESQEAPWAIGHSPTQPAV